MTHNHLLNLQDMNFQLRREPVAVIGMAGIFPQSANLQEYWENILAGVDCITDVPPTRWDVEAYYHPDPREPDKTYCKRGGFIPAVDFNPMEFGLPPNTLEVTDVSQLMALLVARQAMEDAGYGESRQFDREHVAVILGVAAARQLAHPLGARLEYPVWEKVLRSSGLPEETVQQTIEKLKLAYVKWDENAFPGMLANVVAGRIANRLDFGGMNCIVDAACASSLGALRTALAELSDHRCNMALTGGVDTDNSAFAYVCFSKTPALSRRENLRPFDAESDGMMLGEGIGMVVLKRLKDAERDGDRIYALIKGIGSSSDGRYKSIYAPRPEGQVRALRRAYEDAGFEPETVGLIEAHGTGTMAGDVAEFAALKAVFAKNDSAEPHIALGSVKSQIGHTKAAAGAAGIMKAVLALHHKVLPPTINIERPNPKLGIENTPFYLNTMTRPWIRGTQPRRAGVSSFGFGGSNYHVVLEEYTGEHDQPYRLHRPSCGVLVHEEDQAALLAACEALIQKLQSQEAEQVFAEWVEHSRTLSIPSKSARLGFVAASAAEACQLLRLAAAQLLDNSTAEFWTHPKGIFYRRCAEDLQGKVVALFPGQGSQYLEMGRELALNAPCLRQMYDHMDSLLEAQGKEPVSQVFFPPKSFDPAKKEAQTAALRHTENVQPAIAAMSAGLYKMLQQAGFQPNFTVGHSFGELTALWAAGVFDETDYLKLAIARGQAMAMDKSTDRGAMLAVKGNASQLQPLLDSFPEVVIANFNSDQQVVLSGATASIDLLQEELSGQGYTVVRLPVSAAFHTAYVHDASAIFEQALQSTALRSPAIDVYANTTAQFYPKDAQEVQALLTTQITNPVLFKQCIENIYSAGGTCFVEVGPRNILTLLVQEILGERPHIAVALNPSRNGDSDRQMREAIVRLRVAGLSLVDPDIYQVSPPPIPPQKEGSPSVRLESVNYLSEKTKQTMSAVLENGHHPPASQNGHIHNPEVFQNGHTQKPPASQNEHAFQNAPIQHLPANLNGNLTQATSPNSKPLESKEHLETSSFESSLDYLLDYQAQALALYEQFSTQQREYMQTSFQMLGDQNVESVQRSLLRFHNHHTESLAVYEQAISDQAECSAQIFKSFEYQLGAGQVSIPQTVLPQPRSFAPQIEAIPLPEPLPAKNGFEVSLPSAQEPELIAETATIDTKILGESLLTVVSEKTGYPAQMIDLQMDMEADLGIDSIKRVEILGALQDLFPSLPRPDPEELAELGLRTLQQVIDHLHSKLNTTEKKVHAPQVETALKSPVLRLQRSGVALRFLPAPDYRPITLGEGRRCLVSDDGTALTTTLVRILSKEWGWQVIVLSWPQTLVEKQAVLDPDVERICIAELDEAHLQSQVAKLGPIAAFIHLHPVHFGDKKVDRMHFDDREASLVRQVFLMAKVLKQSLTESAKQGYAGFICATQLDGRLGLGKDRDFGVIGGALFGLVKTLRREWEAVFCRGIDLSPDLDVEKASRFLLAEMADPDRRIGETGWSESGRTTLARTPDEPIFSPEGSGIDEQTVFLVSGGAKGITAHCALQIATRYRCRFILVGRSNAELPVDNEAIKNLNERQLKQWIFEQMQGQHPNPAALQQQFERIRSAQEIVRTLEAIRGVGAQVEYVSADITDRNSLRTALLPSIERLGLVTAILHGAGNLADKRIEEKSLQDFDQVFAPKVLGLRNLLECVDIDQLQHLVLFSSVAGFYGNGGQADYAMANEVLNKLAHLGRRTVPHCHTISINWGPWEGGMVTPQLKKLFNENDIETIPIDIGAQMLLESLEANHNEPAQVVIGSALPYTPAKPQTEKVHVERTLSLTANPFLQDHVIQGHPVLPATCALAWMANTCEQLHPGYRFSECEHFRVLKGIVFDGTPTDKYTVEVQTITDSAGALVCETKVWSRNPQGAIRHHYSVKLWLRRRIAERPRDLTLQLPPLPWQDPPTEPIYGNGEGSLFHGLAFQGVRNILVMTPKKIVLECCLPPLTPEQQGQFAVQAFNPYISDVEIHSIWLWLQHFHKEACLPAEFGRFEQFTMVPFDETFYVTMTVQSRTDTALNADLSVHDDQGRIYTRTLGARGTIFSPKRLASPVKAKPRQQA
jgi:acyl transferase domain-containing protein/NAD(P)-dependent dehydrogenase (short-subunit alcohol dehydrogenase family)